MKTFVSLAFVALTAALVSGCSGATEDGNSSTDDDAVKSAAHPAGFVGTWESSGTDHLLFYAYTFKADGTFSARGGCKPNPKGPSCFAITEQSGTWKVGTSGPELGAPAGAPELVLTDSFKQKDTFFFTMKDDVLSLSTTFRGAVSKFDHDVSGLKKLRSGDVCADKNNNSIGVCPESTPCEYNGPSGDVQECLPPI